MLLSIRIIILSLLIMLSIIFSSVLIEDNLYIVTFTTDTNCRKAPNKDSEIIYIFKKNSNNDKENA